MNWGTWYWRRRLAEKHRHRTWDEVKAEREAQALRDRVAVLEAAIRQHMADSDEIGTRRTIDRLLWRAVSEDGLTDWERRYGGC